jgi:hypothetical protein
MMHRLPLALFILFFCFSASSDGSSSIIGSWRFSNDQIEIVAEFLPDGTFRQVNVTAAGRETIAGRFQLTGQTLLMLPRDAPQPQQILCRFSDADTILATYPSGATLQWKRLTAEAAPEKSPKPPESLPDIAAKPTADPPASSISGKHPTLLMQRAWEPNEKAFSFLVPKEWRFKGGIFHVNPFTQKVELDTSAYHHPWMNNHGDILYTDEKAYNPNEHEKRPNHEWKQTPARPR